MHSFLTAIVVNATGKFMGYRWVLVMLAIVAGTTISAPLSANVDSAEPGLRETFARYHSKELLRRLSIRRAQTIKALHAMINKKSNELMTEVAKEARKKPNALLRTNRVLANFNRTEAKRLYDLYVATSVPNTVADFKNEMIESAKTLKSLNHELGEARDFLALRSNSMAADQNPSFRGTVLSIRTPRQVRQEILEVTERDLIRLLKTRDLIQVLLEFPSSKDFLLATDLLSEKSRKSLPWRKRLLLGFINVMQAGASIKGAQQETSQSLALENTPDLAFVQNQRLAIAVLEHRVSWISQAEKTFVETHHKNVDRAIDHFTDQRINLVCGLPLID